MAVSILIGSSVRVQDVCFKIKRLQGHGAAHFGIDGYHRWEVWAIKETDKQRRVTQFTATLGPISSHVLPHQTLGLPA